MKKARVIRNRLLPPKGFTAMNLLGAIFVRRGVRVSSRLVNHERIHTAQMRELLFIFFYLCYLFEWLVRLFMRGNAYRNISFEREAYANDDDEHYLERRKHFAAWRYYLRRKSKKRKNYERH